VTGGARWDLEANKINQYTVGAGYVDDCFVLGVNYVTSYSYVTNLTTPPVLSHAIMLQIGLRTLRQFDRCRPSAVAFNSRGPHCRENSFFVRDLCRFWF